MTRDSCGSSLPPFSSTRVGHGDLADVVKKAAALERREVRGVESQRPAHARRIRRQPLAVPLRQRVARLDRRAHAEDDRLGRLEIVGVALQPDQRLDAGVELQRIERLAQEIVGAGQDAFQAIVALRLRGDDHDRHETRRLLLFELTADVEAVAARRDEIEEHDVRRLRGAGRQHLVRGADH